MKALDLAVDHPRSPTVVVGGYVHLARMIDKARAKMAGSLADYIYPCPLDRSLLEFVGVNSTAFAEAVRSRDDDQVVEWIKRHGRAHSPHDIETWNRTLLDRRPDDEVSRHAFLRQRDAAARERTDVTTWVDLLDLEEGRNVPPR